MKKAKKYVASLLIVALLMVLLGGCTQGPESSEEADPGNEVVFTGTARGYGGEVEVTITFEGDKILSVTAKGDSETAGIGDKALEQLPQTIQEANSVDVEVVSGATITSNAVIEAARTAIAQSKGEAVGELPELVMKPGTYVGKAKGYAGTIEVTVEVSEQEILSIEVTGNIPQENEMIDREFWASKYSIAMLSDTPQILKTVTDRLPDRIVAAQSLAVDAVTGATASSNGVLGAVRDAIVQAGGNPAALNRPVEKSTTEEVYEADVVVVGGGTSGSAAAAAAKDEGASVVLLEKSGRVGGTGSLSSSPMAFDATIQKENGVESEENEIFEEWLAQTHWYVNGTILRKFMKATGSTIDWLESRGFNWTVAPGVKNLVDYADDSLNSMGVVESFESLVSDVDLILYETTAKTLVLDDSGAIAGVLAEKYDGTKVIVHAKSVVIATGGFLGNMELMKKYNNGYSYEVFGLAQNVGEGFKMALEAGAVEWNVGGVCGHLTDVAGRVEGFDIYDTSIPYTLSITPTLLKVSPRGERFMDESAKEDSMTISTNFNLAHGSYNYTIVSQKQLEALKEEGLTGTGMDAVPAGAHFFLQPLDPNYQMKNIEAVFQAAEEIGLVYQGNTLEELAENAGMDAATLIRNVERYNQLCEEGEDTYFNKSAKYLDHLGNEGPYYAVKSVPLAYSSLGGVRVDENMQVLNSDEKPIQGLYAVGMDAVGVIMDGVAYPNLYGMALGWGFNSGRIGGTEAATTVIYAQ